MKMKIIDKGIILLFIGALIMSIMALYNELINHDSDKSAFYLITSIMTFWISYILAHKEDSN